MRDKRKLTGIPDGVIGRLPVYYRYLEELDRNDVKRISSAQLGEALEITAAQIRSDFSYFGSFGQQGYGYRVDELKKQIGAILGLSREYRMVLIGAGNIGRALANYQNFARRGFKIVAIFDSNPLLEGNYLAGCVIQPVSKLESYLKENEIDIGIIATPYEYRQELCDFLVDNGVKGIWNFSPIHLNVPEHVVVEHTHLTDNLLQLSFRLNENALISGGFDEDSQKE
ncbi:MAG: redox-sensing transcriptional repressor Rex [Firmicutes bacterium]|nr:redox-sensing transcriptional repressor Rex [Bacillota bacterium]